MVLIELRGGVLAVRNRGGIAASGAERDRSDGSLPLLLLLVVKGSRVLPLLKLM